MTDYTPSHAVPNSVFGVDFSGGVRAGRKIWVAAGVVEGESVRIDSCDRAAFLPDAGPERGRALAALRAFITAQGASAFGLDFPFGLPCALMGTRTWRDMVDAFATDHADADSFRAACRSQSPVELKRLTDRRAKTPFAAYNLWLYKQTFHGIRDLLAPLMQAGAARVPPMQPPAPGIPWLLEICPASTLKFLGLSRPYKGRTAERRANRAAILDALCADSVNVPDGIRTRALADDEGDALDSIIAAVATARVLRSPLVPPAEDRDDAMVEGWVFF